MFVYFMWKTKRLAKGWKWPSTVKNWPIPIPNAKILLSPKWVLPQDWTNLKVLMILTDKKWKFWTLLVVIFSTSSFIHFFSMRNEEDYAIAAFWLWGRTSSLSLNYPTLIFCKSKLFLHYVYYSSWAKHGKLQPILVTVSLITYF